MRGIGLAIVMMSCFIFMESSGHAMPSGVHEFIAYEASLLSGVSSEIGAYAGDPADCLTDFKDNLCQGAYDEDNFRDPRSDYADIFSWFGLLNWGSHFWDPQGGPQEEDSTTPGKYR